MVGDEVTSKPALLRSAWIAARRREDDPLGAPMMSHDAAHDVPQRDRFGDLVIGIDAREGVVRLDFARLVEVFDRTGVTFVRSPSLSTPLRAWAG